MILTQQEIEFIKSVSTSKTETIISLIEMSSSIDENTMLRITNLFKDEQANQNEQKLLQFLNSKFCDNSVVDYISFSNATDLDTTSINLTSETSENFLIKISNNKFIDIEVSPLSSYSKYQELKLTDQLNNTYIKEYNCYTKDSSNIRTYNGQQVGLSRLYYGEDIINLTDAKDGIPLIHKPEFIYDVFIDDLNSGNVYHGVVSPLTSSIDFPELDTTLGEDSVLYVGLYKSTFDVHYDSFLPCSQGVNIIKSNEKFDIVKIGDNFAIRVKVNKLKNVKQFEISDTETNVNVEVGDIIQFAIPDNQFSNIPFVVINQFSKNVTTSNVDSIIENNCDIKSSKLRKIKGTSHNVVPNSLSIGSSDYYILLPSQKIITMKTDDILFIIETGKPGSASIQSI